MESTKSSKMMMDHETMKVEIPSDQIGSDDQDHQAVAMGSKAVPSGGLTRQPSMTKNNCLCSPTTHAGSFRCRLHRAPSLQRTKSIDASPAPTPTKPINQANITPS